MFSIEYCFVVYQDLRAKAFSNGGFMPIEDWLAFVLNDISVVVYGVSLCLCAVCYK